MKIRIEMHVKVGIPDDHDKKKREVIYNQSEMLYYLPLSHDGHIVPGDQKRFVLPAKPHPHGFHCEAWLGKIKFFWSPGTI